MTLLTREQCTARRTLIGLSKAMLSGRAKALMSNGSLSTNYVGRFEEGDIREPSGAKLQAIEAALQEFEAGHQKLVEIMEAGK